ncbi:C-C chemokine receptor type 8-like [Lissotriton helveticus]
MQTEESIAEPDVSSGLKHALTGIDVSGQPTDSQYWTDYSFSFGTACNKESVRTFGAVFLPTLYILIFVFGLTGNSVVVWVLLICKKTKSMADVCLLNLAISDLLFVVFLPFHAHYAIDQWIFGNVMCKLMFGVYYIGFFSSIFFITLVSLDRYLAVVHAVFALRVRTATWGLIMSTIVWAASISASLPMLVFYQVEREDGSLVCATIYPEESEKEWKLAINFEINILGWLIPLTALIYCNWHILRNLQGSKNKQKVKACRLILLVVLFFFLFWTPYNVVVFLLSLQDLQVLDNCNIMKGLDQALQVTVTTSLIHCCLNPVIYAFVGEKFKKYLTNMGRKYLANVRICRKCVAFSVLSRARLSSERSTSLYSTTPDTII